MAKMGNKEQEDVGYIKKQRRKYTPDLAHFKFTPKSYWDPELARKLYEEYPNSEIKSDSILFEDCIEGMKKMPSNCVDLVIADPPFGIGFSGREEIYNRSKDFVIESYNEINTNYSDFTEKWMGSIQRIMKPEATAYVFSGWNHLEDVLRGARLSGLSTINHLIWKYQFGVFTKNKYVTSHYHLLLLAKNPSKYYFNKLEHYPLDIWDIKRKYRKGERKNATTLPFEVIRRCIDFSSKPGDLVFDPFMGMATTAAVAKSIWRHYYGFEINQNMKSVINKRLLDISPGQEYITLEERLKEIRERAQKKYPQAYKAYLKEIGEKIDATS
jgi:site-specific DNA-methyltransferase (adenine-specific)